MKICIEAQTLNHHQRSGLLTYTEGLVNSLSEVDRDNEYALVFYSLRRTGKDMPGPGDGNFRKHVLRLPDQVFFAHQWIKDHAVLPRFLKQNGVNVFHRPAGYTLPKVKNVRKVITVHDLRTLTINDNFWAQDIRQYKKSLDDADICVTVSECTKRDLIEHFKLDPSRIRVVPLAADRRFAPQSEDEIRAVRKKYRLPPVYLLSVGFVPRKNLDGIMRAFARARIPEEIGLVMTCRMNLETYHALARELDIEKRVAFLSDLRDDELVSLYSGSYCFLFPSLYEGFGLPILEAMQCGTPVITSNISSCPEVAGDAALQVDPKNIDELARKIEDMVNDPALREDLIRRGFERIRHFSWTRFGEAMRQIYTVA